MLCFLYPEFLASFFTLIFLEIILSIDNIIFIVLLSKQLPCNQRAQARYTGLILALLMRFGLLTITSLLINLTKPVIVNKFFIFSTKEIILLIGGLFLFFKVLCELYNHLNNIKKKNKKNKKKTSFFYVVTQIVILDTIFSIDSIMTAVGMIQNLFIIIPAVIISAILMIFLSKLFIKFINSQKKMMLLCLSLLLMISLNLITESLGIYIPKEYLYVSIGFALFIEVLNQIRKNNLKIKKFKQSIRIQIHTKILKIINENKNINKNYIPEKILIKNINDSHKYLYNNTDINIIHKEEKKIITNIINLNETLIQQIMIPRDKIIWINANSEPKIIKKMILDNPYHVLPVCHNKLNDIIGIVPTKKLLKIIDNNEDIYDFSIQYPPIIIPHTLSTVITCSLLRYSKKNIILISNEIGKIKGLITSIEILTILIGNYLKTKYIPKIIINRNDWIVWGSTSINSLKKILNIKIEKNCSNCISLADFLIHKYKDIPKSGEILYYQPYYYHILKSSSYQIYLVKITQNKKNNICLSDEQTEI